MSSGNMKTCANCGNEVREGARFCANCGAAVVQAAAEPSRAEPPPPPLPGGKRRLLWVAVGTAVALLVAGGAVAAALSLTGDDQPSQAELAEVPEDVDSDTTETDLFGDTTDTTDTFGDTTMSTDTTATSNAVNAGEAATWNGDAFTVTDVETSDTAPVADLFGEKREAENGVWLSFKITPADGNDSDVFSTTFHENMQIRGGDGAVYDDVLANLQEQDFANEDDFLVWIDIPVAAVSGAVLEIYDGLHTVDPDPSNPFVDPVPDPAYATRVNLGV